MFSVFSEFLVDFQHYWHMITLIDFYHSLSMEIWVTSSRGKTDFYLQAGFLNCVYKFCLLCNSDCESDINEFYRALVCLLMLWWDSMVTHWVLCGFVSRLHLLRVSLRCSITTAENVTVISLCMYLSWYFWCHDIINYLS